MTESTTQTGRFRLYDKYRRNGGDGCVWDEAVGIAPSIAFVAERLDGTYRIITEYAFSVREVQGYVLWNMTEIMDCPSLEDVGGAETYYDYEYESFGVVDTLREAEKEVAAFIRRLQPEMYLI